MAKANFGMATVLITIVLSVACGSSVPESDGIQFAFGRADTSTIHRSTLLWGGQEDFEILGTWRCAVAAVELGRAGVIDCTNDDISVTTRVKCGDPQTTNDYGYLYLQLNPTASPEQPTARFEIGCLGDE